MSTSSSSSTSMELAHELERPGSALRAVGRGRAACRVKRGQRGEQGWLAPPKRSGAVIDTIRRRSHVRIAGLMVISPEGDPEGRAPVGPALRELATAPGCCERSNWG